MTWIEIEEQALAEVVELMTEAGFINGDEIPNYQSASDIPFFRGLTDREEFKKYDHINYEVVPVEDTQYSDNLKETGWVSIGIDYVTSNKITTKKVIETRKRLEKVFDNVNGWSCFFGGYATDDTSEKLMFQYTIRKVFSYK